MTYNSLLFIYGFFPVSLVVYYLTPKKLSNAVLLILSMVFCTFSGFGFLILMLSFVLINYLIGIIAEKKKIGILAVILGVLLDTALIVFFRADYFAFLSEIIKIPESFFPVGISFFTLSAIGYLIDVCKGEIKAERNIIRFSLYIMLFSSVVMAHTMEYKKFLKVLNNRKYHISEVGKGFSVFVKGLAKKVIVADNIYMLYNAVKSVDTSELSAINAWLGAISYVFCIYFTLSGISDMGIGISRCFGLRFPKSFNYPMFSSRIKYFSAKWHIPIVRWFRKYLTKPIVSLTEIEWLRKVVFIFAWCIFGFWYGFTPSSALWGLFMGISVIIESNISNKKMLRATGVIYTFLFTVLFFVFLNGESILESLRFIFAMIGGNRVLADSLTIYLMRSYLVAILIMMYASTDLFRNMINRSGKIGMVISAISPVVILFVLVVCTALIANDSNTGIMIMEL